MYQFLDETDKVVYIGKAKNLKKRVSSYFQKSRAVTPKITRLIEVTRDLKWIETSSEIEALALEANLVKKLQPKFNALLRDDKNFLYFKITTNEDFPRLLTVRRIESDNAKYFGPQTDARAVRDTLRLAQKLFRLRGCNLAISEESGKAVVTKKTLKYPCLSQHINLCTAPCAGDISSEKYAEQVRAALAFLAGDTRPVIRKLREQMQTAANEKKFELAGQLRDKIHSIEHASGRVIVSDPSLASRDVIGLKIESTKAYFAVLQIRAGKLSDPKNFVVKTGGSDPAEIIAAFLTQYFTLATDFPHEVLAPVAPTDSAVLAEWLAEKTDHKIRLLVPQKGRKENLLRLAEKNAAAFAVQNRAKFENATERTILAATNLARTLKISRELKRIEAYDISHFAGDATVGSMVTFEQGEPKNADYRHFKIRSLAKGKVDDCKSLAEVVGRRMNYLIQQNPAIKIRRATKKDLVFMQEKLAGLKCPADNLPQSFCLIAWHKKEIVGFVREYFWSKEKFTELANLWVAEKFRGQMIGSLLIKTLLKKSKSKKVYLNTITAKIGFYEKLGFQQMLKMHPPLAKKIKNFLRKIPHTDPSWDFWTRGVSLVWTRRAQRTDPSFSAKPDLVVLDGGKGQLSTVLKSVQFPRTTTVVALAKRADEIFTADGRCVRLPKNSAALHLVQRLRDEAHRFANSLREKLQDPVRRAIKIDQPPTAK